MKLLKKLRSKNFDYFQETNLHILQEMWIELGLVKGTGTMSTGLTAMKITPVMILLEDSRQKDFLRTT